MLQQATSDGFPVLQLLPHLGPSPHSVALPRASPLWKQRHTVTADTRFGGPQTSVRVLELSVDVINHHASCEDASRQHIH